MRAPRCELGFNLVSLCLFSRPPPRAPFARSGALSPRASFCENFPAETSVSCSFSVRVFFPRGKLRYRGAGTGRRLGALRAFVRPGCRGGGARPGSALPCCTAGSAATPAIAGIENCGGGCSRRLAEAQANPFIRGGAEARKTFKVRSGGSSLKASGHGLRSCRLSRGSGTGCAGPAGRPAGIPAVEPPAGLPHLLPLRLRLAQSPGPAALRAPAALAMGKRQRRVRGCRLHQSKSSLLVSGRGGNLPRRPHDPARQWQVFEDRTAPC